jgi:hypothetical protein
MRLDRRRLLGAAAAAGLGGAGIYELVDQLTGSTPKRPALVAGLPREQHLLDGLAVIDREGVEVIVPPLHHAIVTARVRAGELRSAQRELEDALRELEGRYAPTPAGLGVTVAWGLPYFETYVRQAWATHRPRDRRARKPALLPARRFPSDPEKTLLESNDVAVLLRSDKLSHIADAQRQLFDQLGVFERTSIRRGFVGGGFDGGPGLPKQMARAAGLTAAELIPDGAELFLGFTSTQKAGLGPGAIANHETLGLVDVGPSGYFFNGTHMHLSHIDEDLETWYLNFDFQERVDTAFRPALQVRYDAQTVRQGPSEAATSGDVARDFKVHGRFGHSSSIQPTSRLQEDVIADDGTVYPKGTAIPQRADFDTLDNPFAWTETPERDHFSTDPSPGVHFVVFNPSSDDFHRNRLAMDGVMPNGDKLALPPRARSQGFNSVLTTTHRQNFLVPPRRHRSFPLVELPQR